MSEKTPVENAAVTPEKLANKRVYRSINIDVVAEEQKAKEAQEVLAKVTKKKGSKTEATPAQGKQKSEADYKAILKGMGFKVE